MKEMEALKLKYIGMAGDTIPIYKDQYDKYWGDINYKVEGRPVFHKYELYMDDYDDWEFSLANNPKISEIYPDVQPEIVSDFEHNDSFRFNYMMLGRLKQDCEYYLGYGNRNERQLWAGNEIKQIEKMKELYNSFPDDKKPQWISMEDIEDYENRIVKGKVEELFKPESDLKETVTDKWLRENHDSIDFALKGTPVVYGHNDEEHSIKCVVIGELNIEKENLLVAQTLKGDLIQAPKEMFKENVKERNMELKDLLKNANTLGIGVDIEKDCVWFVTKEPNRTHKQFVPKSSDECKTFLMEMDKFFKQITPNLEDPNSLRHYAKMVELKNHLKECFEKGVKPLNKNKTSIKEQTTNAIKQVAKKSNQDLKKAKNVISK